MQSLKSLVKYFKKYKLKLLAGFLFILVSNIAAVYVPIFLKDSIDSLQSGVNYDLLRNYALLILAAAFISGIFRFLIRETIIVVSREIEYDLRLDFWNHIQNLSVRYFNNNSTGNIMAHATNDINAVRMFLGPAVMYSIDTGIRFLIILGIMISLSFNLTIYALLPLPFLSYLVYKVSKKIHQKFMLIQDQFSKLTAKAQESFSGIRVVKSYVMEENEIKEFSSLSEDYLKKNMSMIKIQSLFQPILYLITGISIIIVITFGGMKVIEGELTLGQISAFMIYLGLLIWPVIAFGWVANIIQQASASMKRLNKIFDEKYEIKDDEKTDNSIKDIKGKISFNNVSFKYSENMNEVVNNLNFEIKPGMTAAFIGHTGVGKSTIMNLILRLYDSTTGDILIDNINIKNIPLQVLRSNIGFVPQDTFLFSDTLRNNILYGVDAENEDVVFNSTSISRLDKDVENFPLKYETILGERGITLSGGQKQRSSIARALAVDPKILILDDSFSAVDTQTEEEILGRLKSFMKERTSLIISHRISTVKDADVIFVLDKGKIVERGSHDELIRINGIYADLYYKQLLEKELEDIS